MPTPPPLNFVPVDRFDPSAPFDRHDRFSANVPADWVWRPQGDSMPGWGPRERPSRCDGRGAMGRGYVDTGVYRSGQVPSVQVHPSGFEWRQNPRVFSFHGRDSSSVQQGYGTYDTPGFGASAHSRQRSYGGGMRGGPQQYPSSGTGYGAQPDPRVFYGDTSYNAPPPPRMIQSTEDALSQHHQRSDGNARSNNTPSGPRSSGGAQFPAHVRNHPRFAEAEHAAEMVGMFGAQDPRARPYLEILRQISGEMEGARLW
jgi:hypothetical protein